jgi:hypothetical protein
MIREYIKTVDSLVHNGLQYLDFLAILDTTLKPACYLEIGTCEGQSLARFKCDVLCIDPKFVIELSPLRDRRRAFFFQMGSDEFFKAHRVRDFFPTGPDICFLDGMHRFEYLLRDFINAEAACHRNSIILMHDCLPSNERMAERNNRLDEAEDIATRSAWTGDVWRVLTVLKKHRPDLRVMQLDCGPTGLIAVTNVDPTSKLLSHDYNKVVDEAMNLSLSALGLNQLWKLFPTVDTARLAAHPEDITAIFNIA